MTGFTHPEYMNVIFKERTGQTPGQYRASNRARKASGSGALPTKVPAGRN